MRRNSITLNWLILGIVLFLGNAFAGEREEFDYALKLQRDGVYDIAIQQCDVFQRLYPDSYLQDQILQIKAESAFARGEYDLARSAWLRLSLTHSDSDLAPAALNRTADCLIRLERPEEAMRTLIRLHDYYPESPLAPAALLRAAQLSVANPSKQRELLANLLRSEATGSVLSNARLALARSWQTSQDSTRALREFQALLQQSPPDSVRLLAVMESVRLLQNAGKQAESLTLLATERSRVKNRNGVAQLDLLASQTHFAMGDLVGAEQLLKEALNSADSLPVALQDSLHLILGDVYTLEQHLPKAVLEYESLQKTFPEATLRLALLKEWTASTGAALEGFRDVLGDPRSSMELRRIALRHALSVANPGDLPELGQLLSSQPEIMQNDAPALQLELLRALLSHGYLEAAATGLSVLELRHGSYEDEGLQLEMDLAVAREDYREANLAYRRLLESCPLSPLRAEMDQVYTTQIRPRVEADALNQCLLNLMVQQSTQQDPHVLAYSFAQLYLEQLADSASAALQYHKAQESMDLDLRSKAGLGWLRASWNTVAGAQLLQQTRALLKTARQQKLPEKTPLREMELQLLFPVEHEDGEALEQNYTLLRQLYALTPHDPVLLRRLVLNRSQSAELAAEEPQLPLAEEALAWADTLAILDALDSHTHIAAARSALLIEHHAEVSQHAHQVLADPTDPLVVDAELLISALPTTSDAERIQLLQRNQRERRYHPLADEAALQLVGLYQREGRWQEALAICDTLLQNGPSRTPVLPILKQRINPLYYSRGLCLQALGRFEEARTAFRRILLRAPQGERTADVLYRLGECSESLGESDDALMYYRNLNAFFPQAVNNPRGLARMATLYNQRHQESQALKVYNHLKTERQTDPEIGYHWIRTLYGAGRLDQGRSAMQAYLKKHKGHIDPDTVSAAFNLAKGRYLLRNNQLDAALKPLKIVRSRYGKTRFAPEAQLELGRVYLRAGREDDALKELDVFKKGDPLAAEAAMEKGMIFQRRGEGTRAIAEMRRAVDGAPNAAQKRRALGRMISLYRELGFYDGALHAVRQYLKEFPLAKDSYSKEIEVGLLLKELGDLGAAQQQFRRLLPLADVEDEAALQYYIGECCFLERDYRGAVLEFMKVPRLGRDTKLDWGITALYQIGQAWEKLGEPERAIESYQQIVRDQGTRSSYGRTAQERINQLRYRKDGEG